MCIKDYESEIGGQGPVRAVELLGEKMIRWPTYTPRHHVLFSSPSTTRRAMVEVF
jgi:hypothetical protein